MDDLYHSFQSRPSSARTKFEQAIRDIYTMLIGLEAWEGEEYV
jgi:hypothetical protein